MGFLDLDSSPDGPALLAVSGDLDLHTQGQFEMAVCDLLDRSHVVVDLTRLKFLSISALRSLQLCHRYAEARGRVVVYAGAPIHVRRVLSLSHLDRELLLRDSVTVAHRRASSWPTSTSSGASERGARHDLVRTHGGLRADEAAVG